MKMLGLVLLISMASHASEPNLRRATKVTRPYTIYTPMGIGTFANESDVMPGNNSFGIFIQSLSDSKKVCRIRIKAFCDYGFGVSKEIKDKQVNFKIEKRDIYFKTDSNGLLDFFFYCDSGIENKKITIKYEAYNQEYEFSSFPKELLISEKFCKK